MIQPALFLAAQDPFSVYFSRIFTPDPFRGLYHANAFDLLLLVPYFVILTILAAYGLHRYFLVYTYYRYRRNQTPQSVGPMKLLPRVTIQLPLYNERYVVERLIEEVCRM